jgi:hypothetical protein
VNGFWASLGPTTAHTSYSSAKFAVKGFTEALINDFRMNAPHVKVSLVMPGHIGTSIIINSARILGRDPKEMPDDQLEEARAEHPALGFDVSARRTTRSARCSSCARDLPRPGADERRGGREGDPRRRPRERWRILVGEDAHILDRMVRETPEEAYEAPFMQRFVAASGWKLTPQRAEGSSRDVSPALDAQAVDHRAHALGRARER